jgi:hypothetical protein
MAANTDLQRILNGLSTNERWQIANYRPGRRISPQAAEALQRIMVEMAGGMERVQQLLARHGHTQGTPGSGEIFPLDGKLQERSRILFQEIFTPENRQALQERLIAAGHTLEYGPDRIIGPETIAALAQAAARNDFTTVVSGTPAPDAPPRETAAARDARLRREAEEAEARAQAQARADADARARAAAEARARDEAERARLEAQRVAALQADADARAREEEFQQRGETPAVRAARTRLQAAEALLSSEPRTRPVLENGRVRLYRATFSRDLAQRLARGEASLEALVRDAVRGLPSTATTAEIYERLRTAIPDLQFTSTAFTTAVNQFGITIQGGLERRVDIPVADIALHGIRGVTNVGPRALPTTDIAALLPPTGTVAADTAGVSIAPVRVVRALTPTRTLSEEKLAEYRAMDAEEAEIRAVRLRAWENHQRTLEARARGLTPPQNADADGPSTGGLFSGISRWWTERQQRLAAEEQARVQRLQQETRDREARARLLAAADDLRIGRGDGPNITRAGSGLAIGAVNINLDAAARLAQQGNLRSLIQTVARSLPADATSETIATALEAQGLTFADRNAFKNTIDTFRRDTLGEVSPTRINGFHAASITHALQTAMGGNPLAASVGTNIQTVLDQISTAERERVAQLAKAAENVATERAALVGASGPAAGSIRVQDNRVIFGQAGHISMPTALAQEMSAPGALARRITTALQGLPDGATAQDIRTRLLTIPGLQINAVAFTTAVTAYTSRIQGTPPATHPIPALDTALHALSAPALLGGSAHNLQAPVAQALAQSRLDTALAGLRGRNAPTIQRGDRISFGPGMSMSRDDAERVRTAGGFEGLIRSIMEGSSGSPAPTNIGELGTALSTRLPSIQFNRDHFAADAQSLVTLTQGNPATTSVTPTLSQMAMYALGSERMLNGNPHAVTSSAIHTALTLPRQHHQLRYFFIGHGGSDPGSMSAGPVPRPPEIYRRYFVGDGTGFHSAMTAAQWDAWGREPQRFAEHWGATVIANMSVELAQQRGHDARAVPEKGPGLTPWTSGLNDARRDRPDFVSVIHMDWRGPNHPFDQVLVLDRRGLGTTRSGHLAGPVATPSAIEQAGTAVVGMIDSLGLNIFGGRTGSEAQQARFLPTLDPRQYQLPASGSGRAVTPLLIEAGNVVTIGASHSTTAFPADIRQSFFFRTALGITLDADAQALAGSGHPTRFATPTVAPTELLAQEGMARITRSSPAEQLTAWQQLRPAIERMLSGGTAINADQPPTGWTSGAAAWRQLAQGMTRYIQARDAGQLTPSQAGPLTGTTRVVGLSGIPDNLTSTEHILRRFRTGPLSGQGASVTEIRDIARMAGVSDLYFMSRVVAEFERRPTSFDGNNNIFGLTSPGSGGRVSQQFGSRFESALVAAFGHYEENTFAPPGRGQPDPRTLGGVTRRGGSGDRRPDQSTLLGVSRAIIDPERRAELPVQPLGAPNYTAGLPNVTLAAVSLPDPTVSLTGGPRPELAPTGAAADKNTEKKPDGSTSTTAPVQVASAPTLVPPAA